METAKIQKPHAGVPFVIYRAKGCLGALLPCLAVAEFGHNGSLQVSTDGSDAPLHKHCSGNGRLVENQLLGETGIKMKLGTQQRSNATGHAGKLISKVEVELDCCFVQMTSGVPAFQTVDSLSWALPYNNHPFVALS